MAQLTLLLLGSPRIERNGIPIEVDTRKAIALLAYLAVTGQIHSRETLAAIFWPDTAESRARLRRTLSVLHTALARSWLDIDRETISLERNASLWLDVDHFHHLLAICQTHGHAPDTVCPACLVPLSEAAALYRDDFMAGFTLRDSPAFDEWQTFQTARLRRELVNVLQRLGRGYGAQGAFEQAIASIRRWLLLDPLDEAAHCLLMQVYAWGGQRAAALRQYQACARLLNDELGVLPGKETTTLYEQIRDGQFDTGTGRQPWFAGDQLAVIPSPATESNNQPLPLSPPFPTYPTSFIGRTHELAEITKILANPDCRLLTLTGVGGMGKTRLALQVAAAQRTRFTHGVYFVPLESLNSAHLLPTAVTKALGLVLRGDNPDQQLLAALRERNLLLVLDNLEQLMTGADWVGELLAQAPQIKLLVTSRERLNLRGEWFFPVQGMAFPADERATNLAQYGAVELFLQRAKAIQPGFAPGPEEQQAILHICRLLEGMPLGIELAAAWVSLLSCVEIAQEIERSLDFLTTPLRDIPERHRSVRAVFDSTWRYLAEPEQEIMQRLSVFQGSFDRTVAAAVAGATLPALFMLAGKSLLQRGENGRYAMHPLLRYYAAEHLAADTRKVTAVQERHGHYYADWLAQHRTLTNRLDILNEMAANLENIRQAWYWAASHNEKAALDQMIAPLYDLYDARSWYQEAELVLGEGVRWLAAKSETGDELLLAKIRARQGAIYYRLGRLAEGQRYLQSSLATFQMHHDQAETALALRMLGMIAHNQGAYAEAESYDHQALAIYVELNDQQGIADTRHYLGLIASSLGHLQEARHHYLESLAIKREIGDQVGLAYTTNNLGTVAYISGDYPEARQRYEESLRLAEQSGNQHVAGLALNNLGLMAKDGGAADQALSYYEAGLARFQKIGYQVGMAGTLLNIGRITADQGDYASAQARYQSALTIFQSVGDTSGTALCLFNLGRTAEKQNDYVNAQDHYQQSLTIQQEIGEQGEVVFTLMSLGRVAAAIGDYAEARRYLRNSLQMTQAIEAIPAVLQAFTVAAYLFIQTGATTKAAELLGLVWQHPARTQEVVLEAKQLLAELNEAETAVFQEARQEISLETAVQKLLQEFTAPEAPQNDTP